MDGSWELGIFVEDLQLTPRIRVRGDTHIGGVMLQLIEAIEVRMDWSDHALWWPDENRWLLKTRRTLDQIGVQADARLEFHRMHNAIRVQLPDLQELEMRVNFSQSVFAVVIGLCRELGIRHPEELSLRRPLASQETPGNQSNGTLGSRFSSFRRSNRKSPSKPEISNGHGSFNPLLPRQLSQTSQVGSSPRSPSSVSQPPTSPTSSRSLFLQSDELAGLTNSPWISLRSAFADKGLSRPRSLAERAAANELWLDSSRSLMEQGMRPDVSESLRLQLRYKFHVYYDLNVKYDSVRINQIYEQTKWSLLSEELETAEEEALLLAALQLQIFLQAGQPSTSPTGAKSSSLLLDDVDSKVEKVAVGMTSSVNDDDIDAALAELEASLMSDTFLTLGSPKRLTSVHEEQQTPAKQTKQAPQSLNKMPELAGFLKYFKPRKHTLRGFRRSFFVLNETTLQMFADQSRGRLLDKFSLLGAEVAPEVSTALQKFSIHLFIVPSIGESDGAGASSPRMQELWLRCDGKDQFAEWMAGITLASCGKTLASKAAFEAEAAATIAQMELQTPRPQRKQQTNGHQQSLEFDPENFLAPRHTKARKESWLREQILVRHANVSDRSLLDAKLDYIRICQRMPMYGVAYFLVNCTAGIPPNRPAVMSFSDYRREKRQGGGDSGLAAGGAGKFELVGVASNRLMRLDSTTGQLIGTWRLVELRSWTINWETSSVQVSLDRPPHQLLFMPQAPEGSRSGLKLSLCKTLVEFIGGSVFLSLRQSDKSQRLDEEKFHRLTCSRDHTENR